MYNSNDFYASAFLVASGIPLRSHFRTGHITTFTFDDTSKVQDLLNDYYSLQASINPANYAAALKNLKSIIHSVYSNTTANNHHDKSQKGAI